MCVCLAGNLLNQINVCRLCSYVWVVHMWTDSVHFGKKPFHKLLWVLSVCRYVCVCQSWIWLLNSNQRKFSQNFSFRWLLLFCVLLGRSTGQNQDKICALCGLHSPGSWASTRKNCRTNSTSYEIELIIHKTYILLHVYLSLQCSFFFLKLLHCLVLLLICTKGLKDHSNKQHTLIFDTR